MPKNFDDAGPGTDDASPFTVYAPWACSPVGHTLEEAQDQATRLLLGEEQLSVERELWTGELGSEPNLTDAEPVTGDSFGPVEGLAALEQQFRSQLGSAGVAHMGAGVATVLAARQALTISPSQVTTALGTPVVVGAGYGDPNPNRIVMTPPLFVYRSDIFTSSNREGDLLDRRTNDLYAIAERTFVAGWDSCPQALYTDVEFGPVDTMQRRPRSSVLTPPN